MVQMLMRNIACNVSLKLLALPVMPFAHFVVFSKMLGIQSVMDSRRHGKR
jgi:hypothetical protein